MTLSELQELWQSAHPFDPDRGDCQPVRIYFQKRRLAFTANNPILESVRIFHDGRGAASALVALKNARSELCDCLRLTFDKNGNKIFSEQVLGSDVADCAIQTLPSARLMGLCVDFSSGITLSSAYNFPVWATLSHENIKEFTPPKHAKCFVLFSGAQDSPEGKAAIACKKRWEAERRGIFVPVFFLPKNTKTWSEFYLRLGSFQLPSVRIS